MGDDLLILMKLLVFIRSPLLITSNGLLFLWIIGKFKIIF